MLNTIDLVNGFLPLLVLGVCAYFYYARHSHGRRQLDFVNAIRDVLPDFPVTEDHLNKMLTAQADPRMIGYFARLLIHFEKKNGYQGTSDDLLHSLYRAALRYLVQKGELKSRRVSHTELMLDYTEEYLMLKELGLLHPGDDDYTRLTTPEDDSELAGLAHDIRASLSRDEFLQLHAYTIYELTGKGRDAIRSPRPYDYQARTEAEHALIYMDI
jgi:hypothetical protein